MVDNQDFQQRIARIEALTHTLDGTSDPAVRALVKELTQSVMDLHGAAIQRMLETIHESGSAGAGIIDTLGADSLVGSLLVLYGLHPLDIHARVAQAIKRVEPAFRRNQAEVELISVDDGVVRLKVTAPHNAGAGRVLKQSIEEQIYASAPDATRIEGLNALGASELVGIETLVSAGSHHANGVVAAGAGKGSD